MYGKLVNGSIKPAPWRITLNGKQIFNPTVENLITAGYKQIIYTAPPVVVDNGVQTLSTEGETVIFKYTWVEYEEKIVQTWSER